MSLQELTCPRCARTYFACADPSGYVMSQCPWELFEDESTPVAHASERPMGILERAMTLFRVR